MVKLTFNDSSRQSAYGNTSWMVTVVPLVICSCFFKLLAKLIKLVLQKKLASIGIEISAWYVPQFLEKLIEREKRVFKEIIGYAFLDLSIF